MSQQFTVLTQHRVIKSGELQLLANSKEIKITAKTIRRVDSTSGGENAV